MTRPPLCKMHAAAVAALLAADPRRSGPQPGRPTTAEWTVAASYFSERFMLFVILTPGESIIVIGATSASSSPTP